ncbi:chorismate mutase [bacterium]|jgi:chorismate mutase|nr:chorismate mutase [bacterium]
MALRGIRGATTVDANSADEILKETEFLLKNLIEKNNVDSTDIASIFFSLTTDLDAQFPALAARKMGLVDVPLLCLNEINVQNSIKRCIRILIHVNTDASQKDIHHIYLKEAISLRPDKSLNAIK